VRIFHIATAADWKAARRSGSYTTSTRGRTLAQEGFLHASRAEQVAGVFRSFYRDAGEPLVLLTIDTDRLGVPWQEDAVGEETFPHIYGPLAPAAVVAVQPLARDGSAPSFTVVFVKEMLVRVALAVVAMLLAGVGSEGGRLVAGSDGVLPGALVGLVLGIVVFVVALRRRG
jgi:uncharacterized protein (DUF952 family)